jgi:hypothetical protein
MTEEQIKASEIVLAYLENINSHTLGRLLEWQLFGEQDPRQDELLYRAHLSASSFLFAYNAGLSMDLGKGKVNA